MDTIIIVISIDIFIIIIIRNKIKILYILRKYSKFHKGLLRLRSYYEIQNTYYY
jgi:hypothetical protein